MPENAPIIDIGTLILMLIFGGICALATYARSVHLKWSEKWRTECDRAQMYVDANNIILRVWSGEDESSIERAITEFADKWKGMEERADIIKDILEECNKRKNSSVLQCAPFNLN